MTDRNKETKFVELANKRVNRAIKDLRLVSNLANRRNYIFSDDQAKKIVRALQKEVDSVKQSFQSADEESHDEFKL